MNPRKRTNPQPPPTPPPCIELLIRNELKTLFSRGFQTDCLDPLGYDLRLGADMQLVTKGEVKTLSHNEKIEIYPGETVIVRTEEVLDLPNDMFAIGSPKMKLLLDGLWAHGGKTDPRYRGPLILGFQNVGSKPCILKRGQKIFHLTFFRIHGKTPIGYGGRGPGFPDLKKSPLDDFAELNEKLLKEVKTVEGIKSFRICRQILNLKSEIGKSFKIPIFGLIAILLILSLRYMKVVAEEVSFYLTTISAIISILAYVFPWIKKRIRKT